MILAVIMLCLLPSIAHALTIGDRAQTTRTTAVRSTPAGTSIGAQQTGAQGVIFGGPSTAWGFTWWQINYDAGADGWSTEEGYLVAVAPGTAPGKVSGLAFTLVAIADTVRLIWNANTEADLAGYKVYVRFPGGPYTSAGTVTQPSGTVSGLEVGKTYQFVVTAFDRSNNESGYSNEVSTIAK